MSVEKGNSVVVDPMKSGDFEFGVYALKVDAQRCLSRGSVYAIIDCDPGNPRTHIAWYWNSKTQDKSFAQNYRGKLIEFLEVFK